LIELLLGLLLGNEDAVGAPVEMLILGNFVGETAMLTLGDFEGTVGCAIGAIGALVGGEVGGAIGGAVGGEVGGAIGAFVGFLVGDDVGGLARANDDPAEPTGRTKVPA